MLPPAHIATNYIIINTFKKVDRKKFLYIAIGSIFPDIIDKPLGLLIYHSFGNGRLYAHTLLFNLVLLAICIYIGSNAVIFGVCSMLHLVEDKMWRMPHVLFYPFLGSIPKRPCMNFNQRIQSILRDLHNPIRLAINLVGMAIIVAYIILDRRFNLTKH